MKADHFTINYRCVSNFYHSFFNNEMFPAANLYAQQASRGNFTPLTLDKLLHLFGLI